MNKHTAKITSKSIEQSGLPADYRKAIAEYIWNGFDAGATEIELEFVGNEVGYLHSFTIKDNGCGINIQNINETFGHFLDSQKRDSFNKDGFVKGKKGKGRYAFSTFANRCTWSTTFQGPNQEYLEYTITIHKEDLHNFSTSDNAVSKSTQTGTVVQFEDYYQLTSDLLEKKDFEQYLASEFGWFLFLNKENNYKIIINGDELEYKDIIGDYEEIHQIIGSNTFKITFLRWNHKIGDKYFYYFLNSEKKETYRRHTSFNNKAIDFHHSVYVQSQYFDDFIETKDDTPVLSIAGKNQADFSFRELMRVLNKLVVSKERQFIRDQQADKLIYDYKSKGIFPKFRNNTYDSYRQKDLEAVVKELYCVEPKIFHGLNKEQSKTLVGFLNLLLDTDQREKVLDILEGIVKLTDEERTELSESLKKTKLSNISSMIKMLESRFTVVELLKLLVFDLEKFTNERDHIQAVIESNYWLFGEQYHMVSADVNFETVLNNYLHFMEGNSNKQPQKINHKERLRRPDIFICRQIDVIDGSNNEDLIEENIIVELKRPAVIIGKEQYNQVEDYLRFIISEPRFNSTLRKWKFLLIGKSLDSFIVDKHESQKHKGKKFLVESIKNYEIYALTWDDIFKQFDSRHKHLINKLDFKLAVIEELQEKGISFSQSQSDTITSIAVNQ
ncbi:ATP-binding protein [Rubrolithibacter danxiaensis]|uniref:ATP-binding protein n=1 Tax=Rubrolithibacter danxiaensis TaxID=3390805 RepID=UPI003BF8C749